MTRSNPCLLAHKPSTRTEGCWRKQFRRSCRQQGKLGATDISKRNVSGYFPFPGTHPRVYSIEHGPFENIIFLLLDVNSWRFLFVHNCSRAFWLLFSRGCCPGI